MNTETAFVLDYLFAPRVVLALGSAPDARAYFLFSCKKKVAKENARPLRRPALAGCSALLSRYGRAAELGLRPQTVLALFPVAPCAARRRKGQIEKHRNFTANAVSDALGFPPPSCSAEQRRTAGGSRRGLSEGRSPEFRSRPAVRVAQGSRQSRPRNAGVAFSLASFFWRPKRKNARASGAEPRASEFITPLFHFAWNCFPAEQSESPGYQQGESHA